MCNLVFFVCLFVCVLFCLFNITLHGVMQIGPFIFDSFLIHAWKVLATGTNLQLWMVKKILEKFMLLSSEKWRFRNLVKLSVIYTVIISLIETPHSFERNAFCMISSRSWFRWMWWYNIVQCLWSKKSSKSRYPFLIFFNRELF